MIACSVGQIFQPEFEKHQQTIGLGENEVLEINYGANDGLYEGVDSIYSIPLISTHWTFYIESSEFKLSEVFTIQKADLL